MKFLVSMGDFADEGVGRIALVDLDHERSEPVLSFRPPDALRMAGKGFTGMAWMGTPGVSPLAVCGHAAVYRVDATRWEVTGVLHQPCMNDLHHVTFDHGRLLVANTGADRVDVFDDEGRFHGGWDLSPLWLSAARMSARTPSREGWRRALTPGWCGEPIPLDDDRPEGGYYEDAREAPFHARKQRDFVHPNHIAVVEGRPLVTRFQDRTVQDLSDWTTVISETPGHPHDGLFFDECFWITCTHGQILAYALERGRVTGRVVEQIDVFERTGRSGWCRGLWVTRELLIVGLTAIERAPRYRWCERPFEQTETSILALDRKTLSVVARVDLGEEGRKNKLFSILAAP